MPTLDALLYRWICRANESRDSLDLPVGLLEDSIALMKRMLGSEYLERLLIADSNPVHFLDDEANPLRKWLLSAWVDQHVVQVLELAAYFRAFEDDPALCDKVEKLKRDSFWPVFFEMAMATRVKRACRHPQRVSLNPELASSTGDFTISIPGYSIPCECSRLGRSPQITERPALEESLSNRISDGTKRIETPLCVKIRSTKPLTGTTYNSVLQLVRKGLADAQRLNLPAEHGNESTTVTFERLTTLSEQIPFRNVNGSLVHAFVGSDWDSAVRLCRVPANDSEEISERHKRGERFYQYEAVRLFIKFGQPADPPDAFTRLTAKLKKKLKQTKTSAEHFGKIVLIEVAFDLRDVNTGKLANAVREAAIHSRTALAIILANRERNPHIRYHYLQSGTYNETAAKIRPEIVQLFDRLATAEANVDPILESPYRRTWTDAEARARTIGEPTPD